MKKETRSAGKKLKIRQTFRDYPLEKKTCSGYNQDNESQNKLMI
jgi:hypothetical protein